MTDYLRDPNNLNSTTDDDLPGMWSHSDFEGGDPDERSYAERGWPARVMLGVGQMPFRLPTPILDAVMSGELSLDTEPDDD